MATTETTTQPVTIIGPNLPRPLCDKGTFHVHAAGCADIAKTYGRYRLDPFWTIEAASITAVVEDIYSDIIAENEDRDAAFQMCLHDVHIFPCVKLPQGTFDAEVYS